MGTNLLQITQYQRFNRVHLMTALFLSELNSNEKRAYAQTIEWIKNEVKPGENIWVIPSWASYPLMVHAPHAIYAWQFGREAAKKFPGLPRVHIRGEVIPDYVIMFGLRSQEFMRGLDEIHPRPNSVSRSFDARKADESLYVFPVRHTAPPLERRE